jgi:hypothetical protein
VRSENDTSFYRGFVRYTRLLPDGASFVVTPSVGYDTSTSVPKFGPTPTTSASDAWRYGLRGSYRRKLARIVTMSVGLDMLGTATSSRRSGSLDIPPRAGGIFVFGRPPGVTRQRRLVAQPHRRAPYVFTEIALGKPIVPGLRIDLLAARGSAIKPAVVSITPIGFSRLDSGADPRLSMAGPHSASR